MNYTNIVLEHSQHGDSHIGCESTEARFHIWLDRATMQPRVERAHLDGFKHTVIYKNALTKSTEARHKTIKLSSVRGEGKKIYDLLIAAVPRLKFAADAALTAKVAAEAEAHRLAVRAKRISEQADASYALLVAIRKGRASALAAERFGDIDEIINAVEIAA